MPNLMELFLSLLPSLAVLIVLILVGVYWASKLRKDVRDARESDGDLPGQIERLRLEGKLTREEYHAIQGRLKQTGAGGVSDASQEAKPPGTPRSSKLDKVQRKFGP